MPIIPFFKNHLPVKIQFGDYVSNKLSEILIQNSIRKAFIVIDAGLEEIIPQVRLFLAMVETDGISIVKYIKKPGEPTFDLVEEVTAQLKSSQGDAVVAIGGGSVMDTAKLARLCLTHGQSLTEFVSSGMNYIQPTLPLICMPTTAGTGSEVSGGAVVTNKQTGLKKGIANPFLRAQYAIIDPVLTHNLPGIVTSHTGIDALAQAIAAIVAKVRTPVGTAIALEAVGMAGRSLVKVVQDGKDVEARSEMACASLLSGLAMNISDCTAEHSLAQALGAAFQIPHGLSVALVFAETLERERRYVPELLERVADALEGNSTTQRGDGSRAVSAVKRILKEIGIPVLSKVGVTDKDIDGLSRKAMDDFFITMSPSPWSIEEVKEVYRSALKLKER